MKIQRNCKFFEKKTCFSCYKQYIYVYLSQSKTFMVKFDFHNKAKRFVDLRQKVGWKELSLIRMFSTIYITYCGYYEYSAESHRYETM